jgi:hypothetical protein
VRKISPPPGFDPRTVQAVAIRYTDYATPAPSYRYREPIIKTRFVPVVHKQFLKLKMPVELKLLLRSVMNKLAVIRVYNSININFQFYNQ